MRNGWIILTVWTAALLLALYALGVFDTRVQRPHPAADGVITRAELQGIVDRANAIHAQMRLEPIAEECHGRVDKLIEGVKAMAPQMDGRSRVPALIDEAAR